jgi:type II secretory pathway pseudopilin PulG
MVKPIVPTRRRQRGTSLIEALVAVMVMGFGMMAVTGIQGRLRYSGDAAKVRAEATRVAQAEMERLRGYAALSRSDELPAEALVFDEIANEARTINSASADFQLSREVTPLADGGVEVRLAISWEDRTSEAGELSLEWRTALAAVDPKLSLAAFVPPDKGIAQSRPLDRHPAIPARAKPLGERSVIKPSQAGTKALVFNNTNGMVTGLCDVTAGLATQDIGEADIAACSENIVGGAYLLSGHVRFSLGVTPDPLAPNDPVLPIGVAVDLSSSVHPGPPLCYTDSAGNLLAGINATDYYCLIPPRAPTLADPDLYWSGRSRLTELDVSSDGYRVCRYSDDYNGNGQIDNAEHRDGYLKQAQSLAQQNFLVVRHGSSCPAGQRIDIAAQVFSNTVTAQHQPPPPPVN